MRFCKESNGSADQLKRPLNAVFLLPKQAALPNEHTVIQPYSRTYTNQTALQVTRDKWCSRVVLEQNQLIFAFFCSTSRTFTLAHCANYSICNWISIECKVQALDRNQRRLSKWSEGWNDWKISRSQTDSYIDSDLGSQKSQWSAKCLKSKKRYLDIDRRHTLTILVI